MISKFKYMFSKKAINEDLKKVLFNIVTVGGIVGGAFGILISMFIGLPKVQIVAIAAALVILVLGLYLANWKDQVNLSAFLIVAVITLVLFPVMFFTGGGLYGGMGYWFVIGILFNCLLVDGALFYILLVLQIAMTVLCYIVAYLCPDHIILLESTGDVFVDTVQSLLVISLVIGIIVRFQNKVYKEKLKELDLSEKKANEAAKRAMEAGNAKTRFLAQMSHEIRTPINAVLGMNEMILRESDQADIVEYASNIDSAGKTLLSLINSILDFSKIEDGKMEIIPVKYDTASFINELYQSVARRADAKGLSFIMDVDENLPTAMIGDNVRFSQIVMNLLTNAVKYTKKGSVSLSLRLNGMQDNKAKIAVTVKDTGIGIKEEDRERLFESFERLDEVRNHNIEGTGLGLSIVTSLLGMMGSKLSVESVYGSGSTFSFVIEQEVADATPMGDYEKRIQESKAAHDKEDILYAPGSRVLIVDDNDMNLKVARNLLKICGIKPQEALSGKETIEKMKESTFDIVFLDHMMPEMDGIETLHKLQESHLIPEETVMIVLTANAVVGAKENYLKEGFADYLSKPIEIGNLVEILKQYLPQSAYGSAEAEVDDGILEFEPEDGDYIAAVEREEKEPGYDLERLKELGIDTAKGLGYSAGDEAIYFEMLSDFTGGYAEKLAETDRLFAGENWLDYGTMVHAMKSNGKMIGANSVFEIAKKLEEAAKEENAEVIKENHPQLIKIVSETADNIRKALQ